MTNMVNSGDVYERVGEWLIGTAKRNPEALLVLAAGCALLMRGRAASSQDGSAQSGGQSTGSNERWRVSQATEKASGVVSDLQDRVSDVTSSVSDYAGGIGRTISTQTSQIASQAQSTLQTGFGHLLREQPLALVALGLAAGAAVATILPATEVEERTLAPARDAIAGVTGKMGENLIEAASDAGQRLTHGIAERASEGFKELVHEVAEKFTDKVAGKTESPGVVPSNVASALSRGS
jgi:TolA-binding protein